MLILGSGREGYTILFQVPTEEKFQASLSFVDYIRKWLSE